MRPRHALINGSADGSLLAATLPPFYNVTDASMLYDDLTPLLSPLLLRTTPGVCTESVRTLTASEIAWQLTADARGIPLTLVCLLTH